MQLDVRGGAEPGYNRSDAVKATEVEMTNNSFFMKSKSFASAALREDHPEQDLEGHSMTPIQQSNKISSMRRKLAPD